MLKIIGLVAEGALIGLLGYAATNRMRSRCNVRSRSRHRPKKSIR